MNDFLVSFLPWLAMRSLNELVNGCFYALQAYAVARAVRLAWRGR